ncbi:MAG: hypothetical protein ABEJ76_05380 [Halanaeroarchaeum sp.]
MGTIRTPPAEQAKSIFEDLGYEIAGTGSEFSATRDWKEVRVSAVARDGVSAEGGRYRCFVTWADHTDDLADRLRREEPGCEWAVIGVSEDGDYEVARAPPVA